MSELLNLRRNLKIVKGEKPEKYNVMLFGATGSVGSWIAHNLITIPEIGQLVLLGKNTEKLDGLREQLETKLYNEKRNLSLISQPHENPEKFIEKSNISIIFSGVKNPPNPDDDKTIDRSKNLEENLDIISELARKHSGFEGTTIIGTNPTDILSYVFASYSGNNPAKIVGMNYLDTKRAKKIVCEALQNRSIVKGQSDIELFLVGQHNEENTVPVFSSANIGGVELSFLLYSDKSLIREIISKLEEYVSTIYRLSKSTAIETADAVKDVVKAIINEEDVVTASTFLKKRADNKGIYLGWPIKFDNFRAEPQNLHLNDAEKEQFRKICIYTEGIIEDQRRKGKIKGYVESRKETAPKVSIINTQNVRKEKPISIDTKIYAAAGKQHAIVNWFFERPEKPAEIIPCMIQGEERSVACVKFIRYNNKQYLLGSTFNGIFAQNLETNERKEFLIENADPKKGMIRSIGFVAGKLYGSHFNEKSGYGVFVWDFNNAGYGTNEYNGAVGPLASNCSEIMHSGKKITGLKNRITSIAAKNEIVAGDEAGCVYVYNSNFDMLVSNYKTNTLGYSITAIDEAMDRNNKSFIIAGIENGILQGYTIEGKTLEKAFSFPVAVNEKNPIIRDIKTAKIGEDNYVFFTKSNLAVGCKLRDMLTCKNISQLEDVLINYTGANHSLFSLEVV